MITGVLHKDLKIFQRELYAPKGEQAMKSLKGFCFNRLDSDSVSGTLSVKWIRHLIDPL